ncbi:DUF2892 domain-containing protein [Hyphobacterium sp. CCMP332]|nr:DUF2892 domain-containing protein [Hyphobacterium sp. CCMP332]
MKKNVGVMDKLLRMSIVLIIGALYLVDAISGLPAIILGGIALYLTISSFIGFCILYKPFGYSSIEKIKSTKRRKR